MDINTCSLEDLQQVDGIGKVLAQRIIDARPLADWDGVNAIHGIGDKLLGAIKAKATIVTVQQTAHTITTTNGSAGISIIDTTDTKVTTSMALSNENDDSGDDVEPAQVVISDTITTSTTTTTTTKKKRTTKKTTVVVSSDTIVETKTPVRRKKDDIKVLSPEVQRLREKQLKVMADSKQHIDIRTTPSGRGRVRIATWNVRNLSRHREPPLLVKMANVINYFDFITLQEVRDTQVMDMLVPLLDGKWEYTISVAVGDENRKEYYVFLWRQSKVKQLSTPAVVHDATDHFVREPYLGYFRAGKFDFVAASIHIVWGDTKAGRRAEVMRLGNVVKKVLERCQTEKDLILLGDFNMEPEDYSWDLGPNWAPLLLSPAKTTVGDISLYDNIWIQADHTGEWSGHSGVFEFDKILYTPDTVGQRVAKHELSDHRPIWAEFTTLKDNDDDVEVDLTNLTI